MKQLYYVFQSLRHARGSNVIKVVSLGLGLAMSILLACRVAREQSFDTCFHDHKRLYQLWTVFTVGGEEMSPQEMNLGPLAGAVCEHFPEEILAATTVSKYRLNNHIWLGNTDYGSVGNVVADSLFFETMGVEVLQGNPRRELQQKDVVFLSRELARRIFADENPIGRTISVGQEIELSVRGIYADIPENSTIHPYAVTSMPTLLSRNLGNFSWQGGDSWHAYVRLRGDVDLDNLNRRIADVIAEAAPMVDGTGFTSYLRPIADTYRNYEEVRRMDLILLLLAFCVLFVTALNYVLVSVSSLSRRAKAIGVHKCSGAEGTTVFGMFLWETALIVLAALLVTALLFYCFRDFVEDVAGTNLVSLFSLERLWVPLTVVSLLFLVGGVLPGRLFARIPVTQVFRRYAEGKKGWKRPLLFVQFAGVAFICGLLLVTMLQYRHLLHESPGYDPERIVLGTHGGKQDYDGVMAFKAFYENLPYVEAVTNSMYNPFGYSGEMIPDEAGRSLFSTSYDYVAGNYAGVMGIRVLQGRVPRENGEVAVNEEFVRRMHWGNEAIGKVIMTEEGFYIHGQSGNVKVVGVIRDFSIGSFYNETRPFVMHYHPSFGGCVTLRLKEPFAENLQRLNKEVREAFPGNIARFYSMEEKIRENYNDVRVSRNAAAAGAVVILFITLMGLIGYVNDEVQRRSKEIAIRKVNGADILDILEMLARDVLWVALPAVLVGTCIAWYIGEEQLAAFSTRFGNTIPYYVSTALFSLLLIVTCVVLKSWRIATENPVLSIKNE